MSEYERTAAAFAADLEAADLPSAVRDHVGLVLADTVGAIVGGSTDPDTAALADRFAAETPGEATVLGTAHRLEPRFAALVNGTGGTVLELDEGHKYAAGHPAIHVLPAVLAVGETRDASADEFVAAFVAGYEVCARVARASYPLADGYHPHGIWGAVGAAAGVARLRGCDAETTLTAMRIAANSAQQTLMATATEGATVRNSYAGKANLDGVLAVDLARAGFTGLDDGVARHLARTTGEGFDSAELADGLGERWDVLGGYFKRHAACRYTHPTLDALDDLTADAPIDPEAVASVLVETYPTAAGLTPTRPTNALQAKFSVPYAVATRLLHGTSGRESFADESLSEETFDLAERVEVVVADDIAARLPDTRSSRVTVRFTDGSERTAEVEHARGGAERPWREPELREKFDELVVPLLGDEPTRTLWDAARSGEAAPATLCATARR
ncbi:MmgE/PrpD family protein [Salinirubellus salinus]|uniref:MmgE/PrpD family protein n=1 Tax=Salinirubellus salinus TaxID=1364945 RepID=A0A9E7UB57_9EURY|nr:MmgE/PrpD family protein [Salinirubellus salinus]UWM54499.1 MmgE/PrpD family protein [Salinirubellus salinus]